MNPESTKRIYLHGLVSSLSNLVVASFYSLIVVRLSLDYLGKSEYGLLSPVAQASAYISILDLGLTVAFGRILIDYTTGSKERYASALRTATLVFNLLGLIGFLAAVGICLFGAGLLSIPQELRTKFTRLMLAQGFLLFSTFALKPISSPLIANGKHYVVYWIGTVTMAVNGAIFWLALHEGMGIYSSLVGTTTATLLSAMLLWRLSAPYRSTDGVRGSFDRTIFNEVFIFAKDSMVWQIGGQTMGSLPIILATAWFALNATADLSAGLKLVLLAVAVCTRFGDMSVTPLSLEFARGNEAAAARQMTRIAGISGGIGVFAAIYVICANPSFLAWWMLGKVSWTWHANLSAAIWIAILTVAQCLYGYAVISRQMKIIRWALLLECFIYVALAALAKAHAGASSLLWAKPVATLAIGVFVAWRIRIHTTFDTTCLLPVIFRQSLVLAILLYPCLRASTMVSDWINEPLLAFITNSALASLFCLLASMFLFTRETRDDLLRVAKGSFQRIRKPDRGIDPAPTT